jgi:nephrocystin-3
VANASNPRTIRVFLSSTFRDFAEERDLLVRKVFPELRRKCRERQVELVDVDLRWGITEKEAQQGKVLPICLAEIDRSRPWFMGFIGERYGWVPAPEQFDPAIVQEQPWLEEHRGGKSVTELEILHGVLNNPKMAGRAFFYFRDSKWSKKQGGAYLSEGSEEKAKLEGLKDRIRRSGFPVLENYPSPEALAERVKEDLWNLIDEAYPESEVPDALTRERMTHEAYAATRCRLYLGGERYFAALDDAMKAKSFRPVLITGQSGGGKSALLANWVKRWSPKRSKTAVIVHHLGSGSDAADPVRLAVRLMREISRLTGDEFKPENDPDKQLEQLPQWLALASAWAQRSKKELLIVLDGLDKVSDRKHLRWFPAFLPPKVKLLASCLHGEILEAAKGRLDWQELKVKPFTKVEQKSFIGEYLGRYRKALTAKQMKTLQSHPLSGNPLFLLTVLEELRVFGVHEELEQRLNTLLSPPPTKTKGEAPTVDDVFEHVLARVEADIGRKAVQLAMEAIWASREGLFQDELLAIAKLAPARWAQIQNALDESIYESSGKITFGHDYLRKAVEDRYGLTGKRKLKLHRRLAEWYAQREVDERVADELPWQWRQSEEKEELIMCLLNRGVFEYGYGKDEYELLGYWLWTGANIEAEHKLVWTKWQRSLNGQLLAELAWQLGLFLKAAGFYGDLTEALYRRAVASNKKLLGTAHPNTLASMNNLGNLLTDKGNYKEAESLHRQTLRGRKKYLGLEHLDTLSSYLNIGNLLCGRGDYRNAAFNIRQAINGYAKLLGDDHPDTLLSINNFGQLLFLQGDYETSESFLRMSLNGREKVLGKEHPDTLSSVLSLGALLHQKKDYDQARILYCVALNGREKALGKEHPDTLSSVLSLGALLHHQGEYDKAQAFYSRALEGYEKALGAGHPKTLDCVNNLGALFVDKGDCKAAKALYVLALEGREKIFGAEHPDTLSSMSNLGNLLRNKGDYERAVVLHRRALEGREKSLGAEHLDTLTSAYDLAITINRLGQRSEAVQLLRRFAGLSKVARDFVAYNLACYECLLGNTQEAKRLIKAHLLIHPEKKNQAVLDKDFAAIAGYIVSL